MLTCVPAVESHHVNSKAPNTAVGPEVFFIRSTFLKSRFSVDFQSPQFVRKLHLRDMVASLVPKISECTATLFLYLRAEITQPAFLNCVNCVSLR